VSSPPARPSARLTPETRRRLRELFARRPWPPPRPDPLDALLAATAQRVLDDFRDDPPAGLPDCADWCLVVPEARAAALRAEAWAAPLLIAGAESWGRLEEGLRAAVAAGAAVLELEPAGSGPRDWASRLPAGAPGPSELADRLGAEAPAVAGRLATPGFGVIRLLHAWRLESEGWAHLPEVSGVLGIRPPG
jgi:hypothetical protein